LIPIIVTGSEIETVGPRELSERIVQGLMTSEIVDVVGLGSAIPCVIGGVNLSRNIAKFSLKSIVLDNIQIPIYGKQEAIFFELSHEPEVISSFITEFEAKNDQEKFQLTVSVSKGDQIPTVSNQILYKLSKYPIVRVIASGFTIVTAVRATLQVVTSGISIEPVGIIAVSATSINRRDFPGKKVPAINIFLENGHGTTYPARHAEVLALVTQR
jgi:hypothetical protein